MRARCIAGARDITERKDLEAREEAYQERLELNSDRTDARPGAPRRGVGGPYATSSQSPTTKRSPASRSRPSIATMTPMPTHIGSPTLQPS